MFLSEFMGWNATQSKVPVGLCSSLGSWVGMQLKTQCLPLFFHVIMTADALQSSDTQPRESSCQHTPCNFLILNPEMLPNN